MEYCFVSSRGSLRGPATTGSGDGSEQVGHIVGGHHRGGDNSTADHGGEDAGWLQWPRPRPRRRPTRDQRQQPVQRSGRPAAGTDPDTLWADVHSDIVTLLTEHHLPNVAVEPPQHSAGSKYRQIIPLVRPG